MMEDWLVVKGLVVGENTNHRHASTTMMRELVVGENTNSSHLGGW